MNKIAFIFIIIASLFGFKKRSSFYNKAPIGTVKIDSLLFMDKNEVTNLDWREYHYWMEHVFGDSSKEHLSTFPNENVWDNEYNCLTTYTVNYHNHPKYNDYPVVGITQKQAKNYCKWRSERVFELFLIKQGILNHNASQNSRNYFSVDNYFEGKYNNTAPDTRVTKYPAYRLPTEEEWRKSREFFNSYNAKVIKNCNSKKCRVSVTDKSFLKSIDIVPCNEDSPNEPIKGTYCLKNNEIGLYMDGNVSEWLENENQYIGLNWRDTIYTNFDSIKISNSTEDFLGFRCACEWKEYI